MQERKIIITSDGSHTVQVPELNVTYHSIHGALQESRHVFIEAGLHFIMQQFPKQPLHIFEMGFGTGLNAFLTALEAQKTKTKIHYISIELYPLSLNEADLLNYDKMLQDNTSLFQQLHQSSWNEDVMLTDFFTLRKVNDNLLSYSSPQQFNLIYYDAFAPTAQPELWTQAIFEKLYTLLTVNGALVTYCSKGDVRRAMTAAGFVVTKSPGPPGKREMVRADKPLPNPPR